MVKVYFESSNDGETSNGKSAILVAIFDDEEMYSVCTEALEKMAKDINMIVTESVEELTELEDLSSRY